MSQVAGTSIPDVPGIAAIAAIRNRVVRNLEITECYADLSAALRARTGDAADWCTFATWASRQAGQTIRSFERSDTPGKSNATIEHLKKRNDWTEAFANKTKGGQVYAIMKAGTFLCQGARQSVLMVQKSATRSASADGVYAELWPASW